MIDLHCHILPGVDDGPSRVEDSVDMARVAVQDGVRTIVATPHGAQWVYTGNAIETEHRVEALKWELSRQALELDLVHGLEVYLSHETASLHSEGRVFGLNGGRYLLIEFPVNVVPPFTEQVLFELQLRQVVPVIAHPERNQEIAARPKLLRRLVSRGMLAQVTAGSLTGYFGSATRRTAEAMLQDGLVHIIASDAHSANGRSPSLSGAVRRASELIGDEAARAMVTGTPAAILRDEAVVVPEPRPAPRRSWFPFGRKSK